METTEVREVITLMDCPFCGGKCSFGTTKYGATTVRDQECGQDTFHSVNCQMCGAGNKGLRGFESQADAAEHWNKRHSPEPTDQQALSAIERLIPAETTDRAWRKIYRIAHSTVRSHSCHHAHTDWRKAILVKFPREPGAE